MKLTSDRIFAGRRDGREAGEGEGRKRFLSRGPLAEKLASGVAAAVAAAALTLGSCTLSVDGLKAEGDGGATMHDTGSAGTGAGGRDAGVQDAESDARADTGSGGSTDSGGYAGTDSGGYAGDSETGGDTGTGGMDGGAGQDSETGGDTGTGGYSGDTGTAGTDSGGYAGNDGGIADAGQAGTDSGSAGTDSGTAYQGCPGAFDQSWSGVITTTTPRDVGGYHIEYLGKDTDGYALIRISCGGSELVDSLRCEPGQETTVPPTAGDAYLIGITPFSVLDSVVQCAVDVRDP